ncbi:MAG: type II secretion system F family protein [Rhodocyclales bacterium]|nr:type II secretion system F family protein [Rhodocyclales bacterium]
MRYEVKALKQGGVATLALDAADAGDAAAQAQQQGYAVIAVKSRQAWLAGAFGDRGALRRRGSFPLVQFSQELLALLEAGLTLMEAFETLADKELRPEIKSILKQLVARLYEGHPLSYALKQNPECFPPLYVATVRASEKTGALPEALSRFIAYQSQMDSVRRQVVSASIYPALLAVVGGLVTLFLMIYVVPRFSHIYADIGSELPLFSRLLMQWGDLLGSHRTSILAGGAALLALGVHAARQPAVRRWAAQRLWQVPGVGYRLHVYQLARFYRSLGMLLRGGMPVVTSLQMSADLLQTALRDRLALAAEAIREGRSISHAMDKHGLTTPVALRMLRVGERTGQMGDMMERIAAFYEEETARWVERFTKLFEPLLMLFIGGVIGAIVVLMYFPIFELAGSIQ